MAKHNEKGFKTKIVTKEFIDQIIAEDGHSFQCRVVNHFRNDGWIVEISPYYNDNVKNVPREIDIICCKSIPIKNNFGKMISQVFVRLFIECKYIDEDAIFWFDRVDGEKIKKFRERHFGNKQVNITKTHYGENLDVVKLFHDSSGFFPAIIQPLHAMIYYRNKNIAMISNGIPIASVLNYPVIICSSFDKFHRTDFCQSTAREVKNNFLTEVNYAYNDQVSHTAREEYFLVDVVNFKDLESFTKTILAEARELTSVIHFEVNTSDEI